MVKIVAVAVCVVALIFAVVFAFDIDTAKCKYSDPYKTNFSECYLYATKKNLSTVTTDDSTIDEKSALILCMAVKGGYATDNGTAIDVAKAKDYDVFRQMDADPAIKEALKDRMHECLSTEGDGEGFISCYENFYVAVCM